MSKCEHHVCEFCGEEWHGHGHYVTALAATQTEYMIGCGCGWTSQWGSPLATAPLLDAHLAHARHLAEQTERGSGE